MSLPIYHNDPTLKIEHSPQSYKSQFHLNQVGAVEAEDIVEATFTYTDVNSFFVSDTTGNDTTGTGTQALPYATILKAVGECTATRFYVVVLDSVLYGEDLSSVTNAFFEKIYGATGETPTLQRRALLVHSDSDSKYVDKTGSDTTGDGTSANPYLTIWTASEDCDGTHQQVVILDSGAYTEKGLIFTGNFIKLYADNGTAPTVTVDESISAYANMDTDNSFLRPVVSPLEDIRIYYMDYNRFELLSNDNFVNMFTTVRRAVTPTFTLDGAEYKVSQSTDSELEYDKGDTIVFQGSTAPTGITFGVTYYVTLNEPGFFYITDTYAHAIADNKTETITSTGTAVTYYREQDDGYIHFQIFNQEGTLIVSDTQVNTDAANPTAVSVASLVGGGFVIAWGFGYYSGPADQTIFFKIYNNDGSLRKDTVTGATIKATHNAICNQLESKRWVQGLDNGNFVITYAVMLATGAATDLGIEFVVWDSLGTTKVVSETEVTGGSSTAYQKPTIGLLSNSNFVIEYSLGTGVPATGTNGFFAIYEPDGTEAVAPTQYLAGASGYANKIIDLGNTTFAIIYKNSTFIDAIVYNYDGSLEASSVGVSAGLTDWDGHRQGELIWIFSTENNSNPGFGYKVLVLDLAFTVVYETTTYFQQSAGEGSYLTAAIPLRNGTQWAYIHNYEESGEPWPKSFMYFSDLEYFSMIVSVASTVIEGVIIDCNNQYNMELIKMDEDLTVQYCNLLNLNYTNSNSNRDIDVMGYAVKGSYDLIFANNYVFNFLRGLEVISNSVSVSDSVFYTMSIGYAIKITGAGASIIIEHNSLLSNYGGVDLVSNNGSEIIKNNIFHEQNIYDVDVDSALTVTYGIFTGSIGILVTFGTKCITANPLFRNDGALDPDDIDLTLRDISLGDFVDSPAQALSDDNRDAGAYNLLVIGAVDTWTSLTLTKPLAPLLTLEPVGAQFIQAKDGSTSSGVEAMSLRLVLSYPEGLSKSLVESIMDMYNSKLPTVRVYFDPTTYPNTYETYKLMYEAVQVSPKHYKFSEDGAEGVVLSFMRGYE